MEYVRDIINMAQCKKTKKPQTFNKKTLNFLLEVEGFFTSKMRSYIPRLKKLLTQND